jgi:hypothetical protein
VAACGVEMAACGVNVMNTNDKILLFSYKIVSLLAIL